MPSDPKDAEPVLILVTTPCLIIPCFGKGGLGQIVIDNLQPGERRTVQIDGRTIIVHREHVM